MAAYFISIEGGEGAGKSTQIRLLREWLKLSGEKVELTREPGGTAGAEAIRNLLMTGAEDRWHPRAEALLFAAARSDHVEKLIKPALSGGYWVLCDRFIDSSRAYQSGASGLDESDIMQLHDIGSGGLLPDMTLVLDLPLKYAMTRTKDRDGDSTDRFGSRTVEFHERVGQSFRDYAQRDPERFRIIDASGSAEEVHSLIIEQIKMLMS